LKLKCTEFDFGWGSVETPSQDFRGLLLRKRKGKDIGEERVRKKEYEKERK